MHREGLVPWLVLLGRKQTCLLYSKENKSSKISNPPVSPCSRVDDIERLMEGRGRNVPPLIRDFECCQQIQQIERKVCLRDFKVQCTVREYVPWLVLLGRKQTCLLYSKENKSSKISNPSVPPCSRVDDIEWCKIYPPPPPCGVLAPVSGGESERWAFIFNGLNR